MSADAKVFLCCCVLMAFYFGVAIGQQHQPPACPTVPGQQAVSTIDGPDGQMCVYANAYGRATRKLRL